MNNKINWFKRLFMTYDQLAKHFVHASNDDQSIEVTKELNLQLKQNVEDLRQDKEKLNNQIKSFESQIEKWKFQDEQKTKNLDLNKQKISELENRITEVKTQLTEKVHLSHSLKEEINVKLNTLSRIEKTFFAQSGNKGKGELGELQVKTILERSGIPKDMWVENLTVGQNNVEFAIKSGHEEKWIPIDSKVLDTNLDDDNKIIIDEKYVQRIKTQAKEIAKYLNKTNTAGYGVLVLQSDSILMNLYDHFPNIFQEALRDFKIYIASPSSFVQMAWSISQIVDVYERIRGDEKIYKDMIETLNTLQKFAVNLQKVKKSFDVAMESHFPAIEKKHNNLVKRLEKSGKIKDIPNKFNQGNNEGEE